MKVEGEDNGKYKVRLIPPNCHQEQMIVEIVAALDYLDSITNEIFTSIETRLQTNRAKITNISTRIATASDKIAQLQQSKKGIKIISSSKFPEDVSANQSSSASAGILRGIPIMKLKSVPSQKALVNSYEIIARIKSLRSIYDSPVKNLDELLQFYHVRDNYELNGFKANDDSDSAAKLFGLGQPPNMLNNIDSFFVFNGVENAYRLPEKVGATSTDEKYLKKGQKDEPLIGAASALLDHNAISESTTAPDDFYYYPSSVNIPDIDVPDFLPDLPGVMGTFGDLNFTSTSFDSSILFPFQRPTSLLAAGDSSPGDNMLGYNTTNTTPLSPPTASFEAQPLASVASNLPSIPENSVTVSASVAIIAQSPLAGPSKPPPVSSGALRPPPPPPPLPPPMPEQLELGSSAATQKLNIDPKSTNTPQQDKAKSSGGGVDMRSSLMAAIRDAGGTGSGKLKSVKERRDESRRKKQEDQANSAIAGVASAGGTDMLADLKNTLAMRRKGISGNKNDLANKQPDVGDIMQRMSSKIPNLNLDDDEFTKSGDGSDDDGWD